MAPPSPLRTAVGLGSGLLLVLAGAWTLGPVFTAGPPTEAADPEAADPEAADPEAADPEAADPEAADPTSGVLAGICEASAVVADGDGYLVGDNEGETDLYRYGPGLSPREALPLDHPVEDIEALVRLADGGLLVVGSQGRDKKGRRKALREQVLVLGAAPVRPDLTGCPACVEAHSLPPKEGGLSVEGAASWQDRLWLGLRSPLDEGRALLLAVEGDPRVSLQVAELVPLDLGGRGIRDLTVHDGGLLVLAGPTDGTDAPHALFSLPAAGGTPRLLADDLPPGTEGLLVEGRDLLLVSDGDGEPGEACGAPARWYRRPLPSP